jgi:hypothetical protein
MHSSLDEHLYEINYTCTIIQKVPSVFAKVVQNQEQKFLETLQWSNLNFAGLIYFEKSVHVVIFIFES